MEHSILLVDDDERLLSGMIRAMHKQPFKIFTARNGDEALWILKTHRIEVIVSDERMPGLSGSTLLAWVAEHCPDTARIMLTGHADVDVAIRAINEGGICRLFTKPCNEARLAMAIHNIIEENDAREKSRRQLESSQNLLNELERNHETLKIRNRNISEDLERPLNRIDECCRRLESQLEGVLDERAQTLLGEARGAAAEAREIISRLPNLTASDGVPSAPSA